MFASKRKIKHGVALGIAAVAGSAASQQQAHGIRLPGTGGMHQGRHLIVIRLLDGSPGCEQSLQVGDCAADGCVH